MCLSSHNTFFVSLPVQAALSRGRGDSPAGGTGMSARSSITILEPAPFSCRALSKEDEIPLLLWGWGCSQGPGKVGLCVFSIWAPGGRIYRQHCQAGADLGWPMSQLCFPEPARFCAAPGSAEQHCDLRVAGGSLEGSQG